jgi:adenylate cyclase
MPYSKPANEAERPAAVWGLNILDTAPDVAYDDIGELAAQICRRPVSYVSIMDDDRLWLKAKYGLPPSLNQCPREIAFCARAAGQYPSSLDCRGTQEERQGAAEI